MVSARSSGPPTPPGTETATKDYSQFLKDARKRFHFVADTESAIRQEALDDLRFYAGDQWSEQVRSDRALTNRPCLTINRLPQFAKQVINEQRQTRPAIQVNPVGEGADVDTAEIIQGLMRHIEINSDSEIAYDTAFEHAVIHGRGYFRVLTDYVNDKSMDQEIKVSWILDPFTVYMDPSCGEPDCSDAKYCFVIEDIPFDVYKELYSESNVAAYSLADFRSVGDGERDWFAQGNVRVAEYYWVEKKKITLVMLTDGTVIEEDELTDDDEIMQRDGKPVTRESEKPIIHWCRMNAKEILEENIWPGDTIPIIPVFGDMIIVNGKKKLSGIVRYAKDAQRMYNFARTGVVEQIGMSTRTPWIMAEGQEEGHEEEWRQSTTRNQAFLRYKPKTVGNQPVGPPIRNVFEPPIRSLTMALQQSDNDLKATTGIYDASLGEPGPEQSGKAILARQKEGEQANSNLIDNMSRSIRRLGRLILEMIPKIYDVARVVRIINPDQTHKLTLINQEFEEAGIKKIYDLTVGTYDVTITVGPSYQSRRQEFVESVLELVKAAPQIMGVVVDLLVRNFDWPGAQEIADRLKKMLPPQLQDNSEDQPPVPPQLQAQIQQGLQKMAQDQAVIQALSAKVQALQSTLEARVLDAESRERIATMNNQVKILTAQMASKSAELQHLAALDYKGTEHQLDLRQDLLHEHVTIEQDAADKEHEITMAQMSQQQQPDQNQPAAPPQNQ